MTSEHKILIAEDEPTMRLAMKEVLSVLDGCELLEAGDGCQALEIIGKESPDLVILDLLMPKSDGFDVLEALRSREKSGLQGPKVVVLSALNEPNLVETLLRLGAERVLTKPLHIDEIVDLVEDFKAARRSASAISEPAPARA